MRQTTQGLDTGVASPDTQLSNKPSGPKAQNTESVAQPPLPPDRLSPFCRTILKWARKNFLAIVAIAISATSAYFAYQSKSIGLKNFDTQSRNDRPTIAIINAGVEGFGEEKINLSLQFKNIATKTAYSLTIVVVGLDPKTENARQLAHIAGTDPMRNDNSFTTSAPIMRSEMLPVVVLCMLYADEDRQGFTEHLYYDAPDASKITGRIALSTLAPEPYKRVDELKICRM
jgi:hypothetical protein